jgi:hypothetical protein
MAGIEQIDGKPAYRLQGDFTDAFGRQMAARLFQPGFRPAQGQFTLWVDQNTCLLLKSSMQLAWRGVFPINKQKVTVTKRIVMVVRATEIILNPSFAENEFRFSPPKGAKEQYIEGRSQLD